MIQAVHRGFEPYRSQIKRKITDEDIERLLRIPIRRISLYDINKAKQEMKDIRQRLGEIKVHLSDIEGYAIGFLESVIDGQTEHRPRRTEITSFERVDVREAAQRNLTLRYDGETGYLGFGVASGKALFDVSIYDRVLVVRRTGAYSVITVPEKLFVDASLPLLHTAIPEAELNALPYGVEIVRHASSGEAIDAAISAGNTNAALLYWSEVLPQYCCLVTPVIGPEKLDLFRSPHAYYLDAEEARLPLARDIIAGM